MISLLRFLTSARVLWLVVPLLLALLVVLSWLADLFWFEAVGYSQVFWRLLLHQAGTVRRGHPASCSSTPGAISGCSCAASI